ncbi:LuxR family transcriptional regulator [Dactylosporangium sp. NBC_01737]|uniref:LuxR family transcriptional regulator n=1 Tax=Dactylosporangium sp. NBC_01737 TaxID=2975959 RepID=UPI002E15C6C5|nr:LuxR family transcriptional regulator [Dactylosporangium sp. NBC_01737]
MEKWSLTAHADGLLRHALRGSGRRGMRTVNRGHPHSPCQAMIALGRGLRLDEHDNRGAATVQVLRGRVRVTAGDDVTDGTAGQLLIVPDGRSTVTAVEDTVVLLTAAEHASPRDAAAAQTGPCRPVPAPARATPSHGCRAGRTPQRSTREMNP